MALPKTGLLWHFRLQQLMEPCIRAPYCFNQTSTQLRYGTLQKRGVGRCFPNYRQDTNSCDEYEEAYEMVATTTRRASRDTDNRVVMFINIEPDGAGSLNQTICVTVLDLITWWAAVYGAGGNDVIQQLLADPSEDTILRDWTNADFDIARKYINDGAIRSSIYAAGLKISTVKSRPGKEEEEYPITWIHSKAEHSHDKPSIIVYNNPDL